jgi:SAM-dependent methyltransferase
MPVHLQTVHRDLRKLVANDARRGKRLSILDVGGRKSPYTIGLKADITLLDVPQEVGTKSELNLGFTEEILTNLQKKRSNIKDLVIEDMTQSTLKEASFDAVVCVEVIEHIENDEAFVMHIARVIQKGGWAYFTTPNGDFIKNEGPDKNPDHIRHYTKASLEQLLSKYFDEVDVYYAVATGKYRIMGLNSFSFKNPWRFFKSVLGNLVNKYQSKGVDKSENFTAHLIAKAYISDEK